MPWFRERISFSYKELQMLFDVFFCGVSMIFIGFCRVRFRRIITIKYSEWAVSEEWNERPFCGSFLYAIEYEKIVYNSG